MATDYTIPKEEYRALVAKLNEMRLDMSNLMSENAKLRELVCMMLRVAGVAEYATDSEWQVVTDYLRELGIELNDGN